MLGIIFSLCLAQVAAAQPDSPASSLAAAAGLPDFTVTFQDDFDGDTLASGWTVWSVPPDIRDGQMTLAGRQDWRTAVVRPDVAAGKGILQLFRYESGTIEFFLDSGTYETSDFRNLRLAAYGSDIWQIYAAWDSRGVRRTTFDSARLQPGRWYYLLLGLDHTQRLIVQVWEADSSTDYVLNAAVTPLGEGWRDLTWWFGNKVFGGRLIVDAYAEIEFPAAYHLPCSVAASSVVNLRSGPGTRYDRLASLIPYRNVRVLQGAADTGGIIWWQLAGESWVRSDLVVEHGDCETVLSRKL